MKNNLHKIQLSDFILKLKKFIETKKVESEFVGLCCNLGIGRIRQSHPDIFDDWKHFSGDRSYPVPSSDASISASQYYDYIQMNSLGSEEMEESLYSDQQLAYRLDLAKYLLLKLETIVE
jgi:hypothetical protein